VKVILDKNIQLLIVPESNLEALALETWCNKHLKDGSGRIGFVLQMLNEDGKINLNGPIRIGEVRESD